MTAKHLGLAAGYALIFSVAALCGYAATTFVTSTFNPLDWTPAGRLIFMATAIYVYPKLFHEK